MRAVIQADPTGCGIASVAAIAGVTYQRARSAARKLGIRVEDPRLWSETGPVRQLLAHFGLKAARSETPFRSWNAVPNLALLAIKWHREHNKPHWHWVVFTRDDGHARVLDPKKLLRNHARTDFGRMKPKWFIPIAKKR